MGTEDPNSEGTETGVEKSGQDIQVALDGLPNSQVVDVDESGVPTFITGQLGRVAQTVAGGTPDVKPIVLQLSKVFRANPSELNLKHVHNDAQGDQHYRYAQVKNGLEVIGGEIIIHFRNGVAIAANGAARADLRAPAKAEVDSAEAISVAKDASSNVKNVAVAGTPRLAYRLNGSTLDLVYVVRVTGAQKDGIPVVDDVLVNAVDGSVVDRMPRIHSALNREVHNLNHSTSLPGATARSEGGSMNGDAIVDSNYDLLGTVYNTYKDLFGRDSYDNAGAKLISSVHYSNNYVNAYWNGTQMVYGDGDGKTASNLANSLDVTAHELTHAVTERTSNLTYSGESGGLNEAMSDIIGNTAEWYRDGKPVPANANNFLVGDDVWTPGTVGDALRYMCDPAKDGSSLDLWTTSAKSVDVHYSSGIANLAFCLLAKGGTHPRNKTTVSVTGVGFEKAAQIFYKADTAIWTSSTNFAAARTGTEQAATQLGYTAAEVNSVSSAWAAVGVGTAPSGGGTGGGGTGGTGGGTGGSGGGTGSGTALTNGKAVTVSGAKGSQTVYTLAVTAGATGLKFATSGGTGDLDMYVKFGSAPTTTSYDCRPYKSGNNESCSITTAKAGTYYVMLNGYVAYSGASLVGSFTASTGGGGGGGGTTCAHNKCVTGAALASACDPIVTKVCASDNYCCTSAWDAKCVSEVTSIGGGTCP
jgi:vibriolysin